MSTYAMIDYLFKAIIVAALVVYIARFSRFQGKVEYFLSHEWHQFVKDVKEMHGEVVKRVDRTERKINAIESKINTIETKLDKMKP